MHSNFYDLSCLWEVAKRIRDKLGKNEIDAVNQSNHQNKVRLANLRLPNLGVILALTSAQYRELYTHVHCMFLLLQTATRSL